MYIGLHWNCKKLIPCILRNLLSLSLSSLSPSLSQSKVRWPSAKCILRNFFNDHKSEFFRNYFIMREVLQRSFLKKCECKHLFDLLFEVLLYCAIGLAAPPVHCQIWRIRTRDCYFNSLT